MEKSILEPLPDHEAHRGGLPPKAKRRKRLRGRLGLSPCAVPGISLTNYSKNAEQKGWGPPCQVARTTITLSNGVRLTVASRTSLLWTLVLNECIRRGYVIRPADTGSFNCRKIAGTNVWSNHAWANATDVNWNTNPFTTARVTDKPDWLFALFNRYGFANGADYTGKHDWMHHEFMGTPEQADAATVIAQRELAGGGGGGGYVGDLHGMPVMKRGDSNPHIQSWQNWYNAYNFQPPLLPIIKPVSNDFGPQTEDAVRKFQGRYGLSVDGVMGKQTIGKSWDLGWRG